MHVARGGLGSCTGTSPELGSLFGLLGFGVWFVCRRLGLHVSCVGGGRLGMNVCVVYGRRLGRSMSCDTFGGEHSSVRLWGF